MGNSCPSNCLYNCCDLNYNCATNINNCYYYYYNWTWVYWVCSVILFLFILFCCIGLCVRRRNQQLIAQTMIVDNTQLSYRDPMINNNQAYGGYGNYGVYQNNPNINNDPQYNHPQYIHQNIPNLNPNYNHPQNNPPVYQMGQPVFLSDNNQPQYRAV